MQRLLIYSFNEDSGVVGKATNYLLGELKKISDRLIIVCNAYLNPSSRKGLKEITSDVYCLNCKNTISISYSDAILNYCGIDTVLDFDEVILMDDSVWGPLVSLKDIFTKMENISCDYWQISRMIAPQRFLVLRKSFVKRTEFLCYLKKMISRYGRISTNTLPVEIMGNVYTESIYQGMIGETLIDTDGMLDVMQDMDIKLCLLKEKGYPFIDRELFEKSYFEMLESVNIFDFHMVMKELIEEYPMLVNFISSERRIIKTNKLLSKYNRSMINNQKIFIGKLYLDYGSGFSEADKCEGDTLIDINGDFVIRFLPKLERKIVGFRYDPIELIPNLVMTIFSCSCDGVRLFPSHNNGKKCGNNFEFFVTDDPCYEFEFAADMVNEIVIEGNMQFINNCFRDNLCSCEITSFYSNIFWNFGQGYNETDKMTLGLFIDKNGEFEIKAYLDLNNICGLRVDPIEGFKCKLQVYKIMVNDKEVKIKSTNGIMMNINEFVFDTYDPAMELEITQSSAASVCMQGKIEVM